MKVYLWKCRQYCSFSETQVYGDDMCMTDPNHMVGLTSVEFVHFGFQCLGPPSSCMLILMRGLLLQL
jgi:hypothetical protein